MNQIMMMKKVNKLHKRLFKIQFIVSLFVLIYLGFIIMQKRKQEQEWQKVSQVVEQAFQVETVYETQKTTVPVSNYFGKITIPKLDLEYSVFQECNDELLKLLPCKFYGGSLEEKGNICIVGHNYNDHRFFGKLHELKDGDSIYLSNLKGKNYLYVVYDKYKVEANDFDCLRAQKKYDLTLVTCDNVNRKRLVVRAERK